MFNIVDYGAVADGVSLNTAAIQSAIDACYAAGGGRVFVPSGIFKTGTIWLKSGVELHLSIGATLLASDNIDDYNDDDAYEQNSKKTP
jgi:polygalacturonase